MPVLMSPEIAAKFKETWLQVHPESQGGEAASLSQDDSLTSLHWLQNFSILSADPESRPAGPGCLSHQLQLHHRRLYPRSTDSPSSPPAGDTAGTPLCLGSPVTSGSSTDMPNNVGNYAQSLLYLPHDHHHHHHHHQFTPQGSPPEEVDYKSNPKVKPPYSYASLICMAMQASNQPKVTLSTIYNWITENFCYYRHAEPSWQNSIRHNLSLNKCFMKVPRQKDEPGKGGFWQIDPQYAHMFVNGIFKRRRMSANHYGAAAADAHRPNKPPGPAAETVYAGVQNDLRAATEEAYHHHGGLGVGSKRKLLTPKHNSKLVRMPKSPLLATDANGGAGDVVLRGGGDFDLASVFDDVLGGGCSTTFEDLDINTALSSLGCELDPAGLQGRFPAAAVAAVAAPERWCGDAGDAQSPQDQHHQNQHHHHHLSYGYAELSGIMADVHLQQQQQHHQQQHQDQLLQVQLHPLHQFEEPATLFPEQHVAAVVEGVHPWDDIKEELQVIPLGLDQSFGLCDGFFSEVQPWERVQAYM